MDESQEPKERLSFKNPVLLPPAQAREVRLRLQSKPSEIKSGDVDELATLVGRIVGLRSDDYSIVMIRRSVLQPGYYHVLLPRYFVLVKKEANWEIIRIYVRSS